MPANPTVLNVISRGYRATLEEQDDPVVWLDTVLRDQGVDVHVLLQGSAVGYLVRAQDASGLAIGARAQRQAPHLAQDLVRLARKGASVHYVEEDLAARAISPDELIAEVRAISVRALPEFYQRFDQVWTW